MYSAYSSCITQNELALAHVRKYVGIILASFPHTPHGVSLSLLPPLPPSSSLLLALFEHLCALFPVIIITTNTFYRAFSNFLLHSSLLL